MRMSTMAALAVALAITTAAPVLAGPSNPKVKGKVEVEGTIVAVNPASSMFTVQTTKGQAGTVVVLVQRATELKIKHKGDRDEDEDEAREERARVPASLADFRIGDRVKVEGFRLDDGRLLALKVEVKNRVVARTQPQLPPQGLVAQGVVVAKGASSLTVVEPGGASRIVIVPSTVVVTGQRSSFAAIILNDAVRVQGTVNPDNSITARQIEVVFANAFQITGRVTFKSAAPQFLIVNNFTSVNIAGDTRIVSGGQLRSFADLQVGQTITVTGTPVTFGGATIAVNAKVITF